MHEQKMDPMEKIRLKNGMGIPLTDEERRLLFNDNFLFLSSRLARANKAQKIQEEVSKSKKAL